MGSKSKIVKAHTRTESLRATIPAGVVEQLGLKEGDKLDWEIAFEEGQKIVKIWRLK